MQFERFVHGAKVRKTVPSDRSKVCQSRVQVRFVSSFASMSCIGLSISLGVVDS